MVKTSKVYQLDVLAKKQEIARAIAKSAMFDRITLKEIEKLSFQKMVTDSSYHYTVKNKPLNKHVGISYFYSYTLHRVQGKYAYRTT